MFKLFKNHGPGGNGEFIIVTNLKDSATYLNHLCDALDAALNMFEGDSNFTVHGIIPDACRIYEKIINNTKPGAHWHRSGYTEDLTKCTLVYDSENMYIYE